MITYNVISYGMEIGQVFLDKLTHNAVFSWGYGFDGTQYVDPEEVPEIEDAFMREMNRGGM